MKPEWKFVDRATSRNSTGSSTESKAAELEVTFCPDPTVWDGRYANNGWLQELPKPLTKLTWDNAALISPRTAERLGIANYEFLELSISNRTLRIPALIVPGQPDDSISVSLGYGRTRTGRIGNHVGFNAYSIRPATSEWFTGGVQLKRTGKPHEFAVTQSHHSMEGRELVQVQTLAAFTQNSEFIRMSVAIPNNFPPSIPLRPNQKMPGAW